MPSALTATGGGVESPQDAALGAIYTPPFLAAWVASRLCRSLPEKASTVADLACGEGALLDAIAKQSGPLELFGSDVDPIAVRKAAALLPEASLGQLDVLAASLAGIDWLRHSVASGQKIDGIILNPPWGIELSADRSSLRGAGFTLARGQCDSADLFLELAVRLLADGGAAAFILPDSLFFPDHAPVRRFLLETCTLDLVARLGEGFFPGVFRGTAVVVVRRGRPAKRHLIECLRLTPAQRKLVLAQEATLDQIAIDSAHFVPQSRFSLSSDSSFAIDLRQADLKHVKTVYRQPASWTKTLTSGRGVELSKHGEIVVCVECGRGWPRPRKSTPLRCRCGKFIDPSRAPTQRIVRQAQKTRTGTWKRLIAGEDVRRYQCTPSREIQMGIEGINYKSGTDLNSPRLVVRKTGIGLKAAVFSGHALTTQTVFHFQRTSDSPDFLLHYALGVLSSRVMLAVHLKRTGENEWRSHPYVTQTLLAELPIPHPTPGSQQWRQAQAIADLASRQTDRAPTVARDLEIERLVAGLYGLKDADFEWVKRVLDDAQGLETVASLRLAPDLRLTSLQVD
jgi:adenine-specific DNA-methyltransferase